MTVSSNRPFVLRAIPTVLRVALVLGMLYVFLVGVTMISGGIVSLGGDVHARVLQYVANPISGLSAGLLITVLVQSSSVSTATIVGLVGTGTLPVGLAVPMVMGANVGTTITSTFAALGSIRRSEEFRRSLAGATVHDLYNLLLVVVLFPLELATGFLARSATALTGVLRDTDVTVSAGPSPIRRAVAWPFDALRSTGVLPENGVLLGLALLAVGMTLILIALGAVTTNMRRLMVGRVEQAMNRVVSSGGGTTGILVGTIVTIIVNSSSITTAILVPLVGAGVLTLRNAFPVTLGANVGTTLTALLASLAAARPEGLTIALVHVLYNVFGLILVYPFPAIRNIPVWAADRFATIAIRHRALLGVYLGGVFLVGPIFGLLLFG